MINKTDGKLGDFFSKYNLTDSQKTTSQYLNVFLNSDEKIFIFKGYAGTGKTFLIKVLCDYLSANKLPFILMAPTGRAAKGIKEKTKRNASTIHKAIYSFDELKSIEVKNADEEVIMKYYFDIKTNIDSFNCVYIVDEASMLSNIHSEREFYNFGSGFLLDDLFKYIDINSKINKRKIIFVGDNAQLPPVGSNFSFALNENYLKEQYNLNSTNYEMTDVVRQTKDSGILITATNIRIMIKNKVFNQIKLEKKHNDIVSIRTENILEEYVKVTKNELGSDTIIIAYSNAQANVFNRLVRQHFFKNKKSISNGDVIMVVQNNYSYEFELFNGDFGTIESVSEKLEERNIHLKKEKETTIIKLAFRDVVIKFSNSNGEYYFIKCKIFENLLISSEREITPDETRALFVDFIIRHKSLKQGSPEFKLSISKDPYFNCLKIKYGYAITCHKAQGGEWKNIVLDFNLKRSLLNEDSFRWIYTAITRAKETLFTINEPNINILTTIQQQVLGLGKVDVSAMSVNNTDNLIDKIPSIYKFPKENIMIKTMFLVISQVIKGKDLEIYDIKHFQYAERYIFVTSGNNLLVQFFYNGCNKITSILLPTVINEELKIKVTNIFEPLINRELVLNTKLTTFDKGNVKFTKKQGNLKEFYEKVSDKIKLKNVQITEVKHYPYMESYIFKEYNYYARIDFYYNGKGIFTTVKPQSPKSNSEELLNKIIDLLK